MYMVVSIDGLLAILAAFFKQTCHFYYFMYCLSDAVCGK